MAEIHVERKQKPIWPWIIGLLVIIGVIWLIADGSERPMDSGTAIVPTAPGIGIPSDADVTEEEIPVIKPAIGFVTYIKNNENRNKIGDDPDITGEALIKLSIALRDLSNGEGLEEEINLVERDGKQIQQNPEYMDNPDRLSNAFASAVSVMEKIQARDFPDAQSEVNDVREASQRLSTDRDLFEQRNEVTTFFDEAADAVQKMEQEASSNL